MNKIKTIGTLFILAAPSGGGKSSLTKALCQNINQVEVAISHTTRKIREGETNGIHYHFVNDETFLSMIDEDAFVEHALVFGAHYGTSKAALLSKLDAGLDVILDIDWQGARQISQIFDNVASVFIVPPSLDQLKARLLKRAREGEDVIESRMAQAKSEMSHHNEFDYLVINDDFDKALDDLTHIVKAHRLKQSTQAIKSRDLLSNLLESQ